MEWICEGCGVRCCVSMNTKPRNMCLLTPATDSCVNWHEVKEEEPGPLHAPMIQRHKDGRPITFGYAAKVERLRDMQHVIRADLVDALKEKDEEIERLKTKLKTTEQHMNQNADVANNQYTEIAGKDMRIQQLERQVEHFRGRVEEAEKLSISNKEKLSEAYLEIRSKDDELERLNTSAQAGAKALDKLSEEWFDFRSKLNKTYREIKEKDNEIKFLEKELEAQTTYSVEMGVPSETDAYNEAVEKANQEILKNSGELVDKVDEVLTLLHTWEPAKKRKK